jgi:hypothetical protein
MGVPGCGSVDRPSSSLRESRLPRPPAVVAVRRTEFAPAARDAVRVWVCQVDHAPVGGKDWVPPAAPLTVTVAGRLAWVPLAYRMTRVRGPASVGRTVNSTVEPIALALLT